MIKKDVWAWFLRTRFVTQVNVTGWFKVINILIIISFHFIYYYSTWYIKEFTMSIHPFIHSLIHTLIHTYNAWVVRVSLGVNCSTGFYTLFLAWVLGANFNTIIRHSNLRLRGEKFSSPQDRNLYFYHKRQGKTITLLRIFVFIKITTAT